jgi:hypothetical protein
MGIKPEWNVLYVDAIARILHTAHAPVDKHVLIAGGVRSRPHVHRREVIYRYGDSAHRMVSGGCIGSSVELATIAIEQLIVTGLTFA